MDCLEAPSVPFALLGIELTDQVDDAVEPGSFALQHRLTSQCAKHARGLQQWRLEHHSLRSGTSAAACCERFPHDHHSLPAYPRRRRMNYARISTRRKPLGITSHYAIEGSPITETQSCVQMFAHGLAMGVNVAIHAPY